jgi:hypothetical protein
MRHLRWPVTGLTTAACLWLAAGCGGTPSVTSSTSEATVKGVVRIGGKPASEGEIVFDPANYKRPDAAKRTAPIGKDGTYTITTLTGANQVRLGGSLVHKNQVLGYVTRDFEVRSGENTFDFDAKAN